VTLLEARQILAAYLVGRRVTRRQLEEARARFNEQPDSLAFARELLVTGEWTSGCERFRSSLEEFSMIPVSEQSNRMPSMVAHVTDCPACRAAYWEVTPQFVQGIATPTRQAVRRLAASIELAVRKVQGLVEVGLGPMPIGHLSGAVPGMATLGDDQEPRSDGYIWRLRDDDTDTAVDLAIRLGEAGGLIVRCDFQRSSDIESGARIELRTPAGRVSFASHLAEIEREPLHIDAGMAGTWTIRITIPELAWEIPVNIRSSY
jgi:hypothetical protein